MTEKIKEATLRVSEMEEIFDCLCRGFKESPDTFFEREENKEKLKKLTDYYESEDWLFDFTLDSEGLLPKTLKRGVLSEDGVWNFLELVRSRNAF